MKEFYEGQVYEVSPITFDVIQFKGEKVQNFKKTKFLVIPQFNETDKENFLIINYFRDVEVSANCRESCDTDELHSNETDMQDSYEPCSDENCSKERQGILKYPELQEFLIYKTILVHSEVILVKKPLIFKEFEEKGSKFLKILEFTNQKYSLMIESGVVIKYGDVFKVFGRGEYIFKTSNIVYRFRQSN